MVKQEYEVSIIGVGNIGFRYLEAILQEKIITKINLVEYNLEELKEKLSNIEFKNKKFNLYKIISKNLLNSKLIIISTNSGERFEICKELKKIGYYGDLILEKFLFPNLETIIKSEELFKNYPSKIYVNQWMRKTDLTIMLKNIVPSKIKIYGKNLGLLCNGVHYLDLILETFNINNLLLDIKNSHITKIIESKRKGYSEIYGCLSWSDCSGNINFSLEDNHEDNENENVFFQISDSKNQKLYKYDGNELSLVNSNKKYRIPYLSSHARDSIVSILEKKDPIIPSFKKSIVHHKLFLDSLSKLLKFDDYKKLRIT